MKCFNCKEIIATCMVISHLNQDKILTYEGQQFIYHYHCYRELFD